MGVKVKNHALAKPWAVKHYYLQMKHVVFLLTIFITTNEISAQRITSNIICIKDTVLVQGMWTYPRNYKLEDNTGSFLATYCDIKKDLGIRFDFGISEYVHSKPVADWIGNHLGPNINFIIAFNKFGLGFRYKPSTVNPKEELTFGNSNLPKDAELDPIKRDYYLSYEFGLSNTISIEPSVGWTYCSFKVINADKLKQQFSFNKTNGLLTGLTLNKYMTWGNFKYAALYARVNYGFVDYSKIHTNLKDGYTEVALGVSVKLYFRNRMFNVIKGNKD